jgi:hypothetical protein
MSIVNWAECRFQLRISARIAFTASSDTAGLNLMKYFPCDSSSFAAETYSRENRISRSDTSSVGHHPCNRQPSSCPDEVPAHILAIARRSLPEPPGLPLPSCNARWPLQQGPQLLLVLLAITILRGGRPIPRVCAKTILYKNVFLEVFQAVRGLVNTTESCLQHAATQGGQTVGICWRLVE